MPVKNITKFYLAKPQIRDFFSKYGQTVFTENDLANILSENREIWRLGKTWSTTDFFRALSDNLNAKKIVIKFPHRKYIRYIFKEQSIYDIAETLEKFAYFSHYSAIFLNDLTEQIPKNIYLNVEQPSFGYSSGLTQAGINRAFARAPRVSNNVAEINGYKIIMISGKNTGKAGVNKRSFMGVNKQLDVTSLERTLIDIVVRPFYSGGISQILEAYKNAQAQGVSVNKLCQLLKKINYTYPYHQAIGYYMERSGAFSEFQLAQIEKKFEFKFDFYLAYKMKEKKYSKRWRLFYPKGF